MARAIDITERANANRRQFLSRAGKLGIVAVAAPALAACEILAARDDNRHTVTINRNRRFEPATLTIPVGSTVVWENMSETRHGVTTDGSDLDGADEILLPDGVQPFSSGALFTGQTWTLTFTIPGSYVYVCPYHHDTGMIGTITVEE